MAPRPLSACAPAAPRRQEGGPSCGGRGGGGHDMVAAPRELQVAKPGGNRFGLRVIQAAPRVSKAQFAGNPPKMETTICSKNNGTQLLEHAVESEVVRPTL